MSKHVSKKVKSKHVRNTNLLQKVSYQGNYDVSTTIELVKYNKHKVSVKNIMPDMSLRNEIDSESVSWLKVVGFSDVTLISNICKEFGIQRFDIKDLFSNMKVTKVVAYDKVTFVMMSGCPQPESENLDMEQVAFILGENYVISFQESASNIFDDVVAGIQEYRVQLRDKGSDYLLYILLNSVHVDYVYAIDRIQDRLEEMEDRLINQEENAKKIMPFFRTQKVAYTLIRRSLVPLREEFNNLMHNSNGLIEDNNMIYFDDFDDRLRTTLDEVEILSESIASLMDLYFNNNNLRMNEVMKRLTVVSTIFIPLTFMVGVWGMNFRFMPELEWEYGYFYSWGILLIVAVIAILFLKKKRWF